MAVSKVRTAAAALGLDPDAELTEHEVVAAYRALAKDAHPDAGGSPEAWQALADARMIMLRHVARRAPQNTLPDGRTRCPGCNGAGTVQIRRAWRAMTSRCPLCKGTGASAGAAL